MLDWYDLIEFYIDDEDMEEIFEEWEMMPSEDEIEEMYKEYCKLYRDLQDS